MAGKIRRLPEDLSNKIAAGEVIERPASVVKETIENALDAGASRIDVELEQAGLSLIRVRDDGEGMSREDALLACERHATSKIRMLEDLSAIHTLGFRGEALASIAAVARLRLQTQPAGDLTGTEIELIPGGKPEVREIGIPRGTVLEVRDLFFNLPARRKFLKSEATELGHVSRVVHDLAMANCSVHIRLRHGDRLLIDALPTPDPLQRLSSIVGTEAARTLVMLRSSRGSLDVEALISKPGEGRRDRGAQHFYVNGRPVRDRLMGHALQEATRTLFPGDAFPVAYLFLSLDPGDVDVNVHPTKAEVRFARSQEVHRFLVESLRIQLIQTLRGEGAVLAEPAPGGSGSESGAGDANLLREEAAPFFTSRLSPLQSSFPSTMIWSPVPVEPFVQPPTLSADLIHLSPLGQIDQTFLLFEGPRGLYVMDQHTAHERVLYERFRRQWERGAVEVQGLLIPEVVELEPEQACWLSEHLAELEALGFEVEPFGGHSFAIRAAPASLLAPGTCLAGVRNLFLGLVDFLEHWGGPSPLPNLADAVVQVMACHQAVRAHDPLGPEEMRALLRELMAAESPFTCPHGRPTILLWSLQDLQKEFLRK
ncbi:MAG: DNA mismatch repair endonuclease MutL [Candidatus Tectomicrobia bacterium]|uniref:DNA mismatch repair protein MutL n=1 Tax=Tectimicrobiota bacterium TaxID=2528274 RepID=A0A932GPR3_UNCTE|nr:DNA mismatch repair endonuclease MutL [Candidatus Tectomicrobia bacterium]